ncbi:HAMP domain-containing protein [Pelagibius litoralis]|uniref:histidine kinase n=1 Tax=Pelagibius litoralis TaxID=374515 RepID=A0A967EWR7_9PROT|nr:stimulus-sensing domain-containing protein [Pelagibius litoralis]NIA68013.1 HAMP domain-containing protein [Pelagibius litoralis]
MTAESEEKPGLGLGRWFARTKPRQASKGVGAEATVPRPLPRRRRRWRSPLTRRILTINVLVLLIPVLGLLHLDQYRQSLIAAELDALRIQGRAFSLSLGSTAVVATQVGDEQLLPEVTRNLMRVLLVDTGVRARIFARSGDLLADSFILSGPGGKVQVMALPPEKKGGLSLLGRLYEAALKWVSGNDDFPPYREERVQKAADYGEVGGALAGDSPGMVRADRQGRLVLSIAVPVQRYRQVLGALMLSKDGADVDEAVDDRRRDILIVCGLAFAVTVLLSFYLAGTIARPIRRLAQAADLVRYGKGRQYEIPDFRRRGDEIGDLSDALRSMTEALWNRMDAIEAFAADVAHEIKNPLTSLRSAVETVARIEDPDQQRRLMSIILDDVHRLDRLISDISDASRLDAELSRAQTESIDVGELLRALVSLHQAVDAEQGPRFTLDLLDHQDLRVPGLEDRLGQVFRNLITNAITFSPPDGQIRLAAQRQGEDIEVSICDDGPGIPEGKLEAVFERFYTERPAGEKFGTHSGLGLSISKQIVEAHGGTIEAENRCDPDGTVRGACFVVTLPAE